MITRKDLEQAYDKAHTSQLWLYCQDVEGREDAIQSVLTEVNTPASGMYAGTMLDHPRTAEWGADMLDGLLRKMALTKFVGLLGVDEIVPMIKALRKVTFDGFPVVAISTRYIVRLRDITDEWNRQHEGEDDKQIYIESSYSW